MKILREVLITLNDWVEDGMPEHGVFNQDGAICDNIERYFFAKFTIDPSPHLMALGDLFRSDGLDGNFPFNNNAKKWTEELFADQTWHNEKRLAWLKKHGARTISDCVPLALRTENPEIFILANVYLRGEDVYCLSKLWWHHPRLGLVEIEDFVIKQRARDLLSSLDVKLNFR